jgi:hypothetical protein
VLHAPDRVVPDHGEVWCRPVELLATSPSRAVLQQTGIAEEHVLRRTLTLDGARLRIDYELENLRGTPYEALWAAHPLLRLTPDCRLLLAGIEEATVYASSFARRGESIAVRRVVLGETAIDLTRPATIPSGHTLKAFAPLPPGAQVGVLYPADGAGLLLRLDADRPAWLGLWVNTGGFPAHAPVSHLALEPSFGSGDRLSETIADRTCLRLPGHGSTRWSLELELSPG